MTTQGRRWQYILAKRIKSEDLQWGPCPVSGCTTQNCPIVPPGDPAFPVGSLCSRWEANNNARNEYDPEGLPDFGKGCGAKKDTLRKRYNNKKLAGRPAAAALETTVGPASAIWTDDEAPSEGTDGNNAYYEYDEEDDSDYALDDASGVSDALEDPLDQVHGA